MEEEEDGETAAYWRVVHIPGKPPVSPTQQPTVEVVASTVEPKLANSIIRRLNQIAPLENLRHVKRIRKDKLEGGNAQLSVILCLASDSSDLMSSLTPELQQLVDSYQFANLLRPLKKSGMSNASYGQHLIILRHTTLMASLDLVRRTQD